MDRVLFRFCRTLFAPNPIFHGGFRRVFCDAIHVACPMASHQFFSQSVLGDAISVDQKDYYCIEIGLPDAPKGPTTELFMLDTAATSSLLTPRAYERLGGKHSLATRLGAVPSMYVAFVCSKRPSMPVRMCVSWRLPRLAAYCCQRPMWRMPRARLIANSILEKHLRCYISRRLQHPVAGFGACGVCRLVIGCMWIQLGNLRCLSILHWLLPPLDTGSWFWAGAGASAGVGVVPSALLLL